MRKVEAETRCGLAVPDSGQTCVLPCSVAILVLVLRRTEHGEVVRTAWWAGVSCMPHQVVCCGHADRSDGAKHLVAYVGSLGGTLRPPPRYWPSLSDLRRRTRAIRPCGHVSDASRQKNADCWTTGTALLHSCCTFRHVRGIEDIEGLDTLLRGWDT